MTGRPLAAPRLFNPNLAQAPPGSTNDCTRCDKQCSERVDHSPWIGSLVEPSCLVVVSTTVDGKQSPVLMESKCGQRKAKTCTSHNLPTRTGVYFNDVELGSAIHPLQQCNSNLETTKSYSPRACNTDGAISPLERPQRAALALRKPRLFSCQMPIPSRQRKRSSSSEINGIVNTKRHDSSVPRKKIPITSAPELCQERSSKINTSAFVEASVVFEAAIALAKLGG